MIGSSLAKYLVKENDGLKVALIGPGEEKDRQSTDIHGAYYDEGRVASVLDPDSMWSILSERSIHRYRKIEKESGINFYVESGYLSVGIKETPRLRNIKANVEARCHNVKYLSYSQLVERYPYMSFGQLDEGICPARDAGYINPRPLVKAQIELAKRYGCEAFDIIVDHISHNELDRHVLTLADGRKVVAKRVILATGGFTFCRSLMPRGIIPDVRLNPNTVILVEVDEGERTIAKGMPSMSYRGGRFTEQGQICTSYILPPIQYPNGKYYLKVGMPSAATPFIKSLTSPAELHSWYCNGSMPDIENQLVSMVKSLFPGLKLKNYHFDYCATARTSHSHPYVSMLTPSFGVAIGGCGLAAQSSDEIGLMAARMIAKGAWNHDLPEKEFLFVQKTSSKI